MPPTGLDNQQQKIEPAAVGKLSLSDLGERPKTTEQPGAQAPEKTVQALDKPQATKNATDAGDHRNVDPMRQAEIAKEPYKVPETAADRNNALKEHRESTSSTGFAGPKVLVDNAGQEMKGIQSYDKKTGQSNFHQQNNDGTYTQYNLQDNGKSLHKLDGNGKPTGEIVRLQPERQNNQNSLEPKDSTKAQPLNPHEAVRQNQHETQQNPHDPASKPLDSIQKPHDPLQKAQETVQKPQAPEQKSLEQARKPQDLVQKVQDPAQKSPEPVRKDPFQKAQDPLVQKSFEPVHKQADPVQKAQDPPQRPLETGHRDFVQAQDPAQRTLETGRKQQDPVQKAQDPLQRPLESLHRDFVPKAQDPLVQKSQDFVPKNQPLSQPLSQSQNQIPGRPYPQEQALRPVPARPDQGVDSLRRDVTRTQPELQNRDQARPVLSRDNSRPAETIQARPIDGPALRVPTVADGIRTVMDGAKGPHFVPGLDARGPHGLDLSKVLPGLPGQQTLDAGKALPHSGPRDIFNLRAELNVKPFLDAHRSDLQNPLILRSLNPEHLSGIQRSLSIPHGDLAIRQQGAGHEGDRAAILNKHADTGLQPKEQSLPGRQQTVEPIGRQIAQVLEFLSKSQQLDRIPTAEQSRLLLSELFRTRLDQASNHDLTNPLMQIQRSLNQRNIEAGAPNQTFVIKAQQMDALKELLNTVKNQDLLSKDPNRVAEINKANEAKVASLTNSSKVLDSENTSKAEQNKAVRDLLANKDIQTGKQQLTPTIDRRPGSESKTEPPEAKRPAADGNKVGNHDDKKTAKPEDSNTRKTKQQEQLTQEELAIALANKLRIQKEKEAKEKEKERAQEKGKKDPQQKTRLKYRIKENDTLAALAAKFLNDAKLAAAIFHINRSVIPVINYQGNTYASPPMNQMIWLPCDDDIDTFNATGAGKEYSKIGFAGVEYSSAEEELAARFGRRWFSPTSNRPVQSQSQDQSTRRANIEKVLGTFAPQHEETRRVIGDPEKRRANIEEILGPLRAEASDGRNRYTVRLGETLRSIALKHPLLSNVDAWQLLAAVNGLSTETDAKGCPLAVPKRGTTLIIPTKEELKAFRTTGIVPTGELDFTPPVNHVAIISATIIETSVSTVRS